MPARPRRHSPPRGTNHRRPPATLCGLFLCLLPLTLCAHDERPDPIDRADPKALYEQMIRSPAHYNYTGTFTYEQGGNIQTFALASQTDGNLIAQSLEPLDGPAHSHAHRFDSRCKHRERKGAAQIGDYYNFYTRGEVRIAGHPGIEIALAPVDKYRNGFQYVVAAESGLMLRAIALTPGRKMVERTQFVSLDYRPHTADSSPAPLASRAPAQVACERLRIDNGWTASWTPDGFKLVDSSLQDDRAALVYSDGLATFSVFIESVLESFLPAGAARRGATTVYLNYLADESATYLVSVVGEIPLATAERVLASLHRR